MKNLRRLLALLTAATMITITGCATVGGQSTQSAPAATEASEEAPAAEAEALSEAESAEEPSETETAASPQEKESYLIGICQLVQHPALDAATQGFKDALTEEFGEAVSFDEQNAAGDTSTAATICTNLVSENVDLILANATPALQAAAAATNEIPVLGTSITEYGVALEIEDFNGTVGGNISGTSDLPPLDKQAAMVTELFPEAKTAGILYCSAEPNSKYQADMVKQNLEASGLTVNIYTFSDSNDVAAVTGEAVANVDVIYIPTDNTAASCTEAINNVAKPAGIPIVAGEEGIMSGCGVATLSISYYDLGVTTGKMAIRILKGEENISEMPIEYYPDPVKKYNPVLSEALGVTIPDDYTAAE
ncbi:MAG TPA: ABC transporter substrate-binding protein [Lachnospiraceae bacterium]|nr:ABC transporter substrate-binding protein [Lachnospiraceae bacterium]